MTETAIFTELPPKLQEINNKIYQLMSEKKIYLQNGDLGFASAPSNIALLKYWGKAEDKLQYPLNSSISFTLGGFRAFTKVIVQGRMHANSEKKFFKNKLFLNNNSSEIELPLKMQKIINTIFLPCLSDIALEIKSYNNFPTACGIASSAAGYAALIAAIADLLQLEKILLKDDLQYWLCEWARIGSGSATRSVFPSSDLFIKWNIFDNSSNKLEFSKTNSLIYHSKWHDLKHAVFILDSKEKSISSSAGHKYASTSPFHSIRVAGIAQKVAALEKALATFDFQTVKTLTEEDALLMHAVMQTGSTPACYLSSEVAEVISLFIKFRDQNNAEAFWTLDAGPNIHFLYLPSAETFMRDFLTLCENTFKRPIETLLNKKTAGCALGKNQYLELEKQEQLIGKLQ